MAGAGYDVSASRSEAQSQAANQQAGTVINFGAGARAGDWYGDQSATPNSTAVAARTAGATDSNSQGGTGGAEPWHAKIDWVMVGIAGVVVLSVVGAIYFAHKKGS